jgi:hypothetical protein
MDRREFLKIAATYAAGAAVTAGTVVLGSAGCTHRLVSSDDLKVREGWTHPYTLMTWEEGSSRLHRIASSYQTDKEEAWLVFRVPRNEKLLWVDTGYLQESASLSISKQIVDGAVDVAKTHLPNSTVEDNALCHIHPLKAVIEGLKEKEGRLDGEPRLDGLIRQYHIEIGSLPSADDLVTHMEIRKYLREEKDYRLGRGWVVTPTGMFMYDPGPSLEKLYRNSGMEAMEFVVMCALIEGFKSRDLDKAIRCFRKEGLDISYYMIPPSMIRFPIKI